MTDPKHPAVLAAERWFATDQTKSDLAQSVPAEFKGSEVVEWLTRLQAWLIAHHCKATAQRAAELAQDIAANFD